MKLSKDKKAIDVVTVSDELRDAGQLEFVGGMEYITEIFTNTYAPNHITTYINIVYENYVRREIMKLGNEISNACLDPNGRSSLEILREFENKIFAIAQRHLRGSGGFESVQSIAKRFMDDLDKRMNNPGSISGLSTGFKDLDDITLGLQNGDLFILAARPSMGKTALAMNIAENVAIKSGKTVLFFSMEMKKDDLEARMYASLGRINLKSIRTGILKDEETARFTHANELVKMAKMQIDDTGGLTPSELRARARKMAREHDIGLIVVDYLQQMKVPGLEGNRTSEITEISRCLKLLAKELNVPVIALSQLNRSFGNRQDKRPILSDLRESGAIEQDADVVAFIYRDEMHDPNTPNKGVAEVIIGKHRNGEIGTVLLTFAGHYCRFENYATRTITRGDL